VTIDSFGLLGRLQPTLSGGPQLNAGPSSRLSSKNTDIATYSHLTLLVSVLRYFLSYITFNYYSSWAQLSYRVAFLAAAATYGIVVYKQHIVRGNLAYNAPTILKLASDENVQYLGKQDDKIHLLSGSRIFPAY
jgi:Transmembrane protein 33/Nucleoporin POM33